MSTTVPPEPPVGTWMKDRFGAVTMHHAGGGWAPVGCMPFGRWEAMWGARGPYVECGPWGEQLKPAVEEPTQFGSIVRASTAEYEEQLWTPAPYIGEHYWMAETRAYDVWPKLTDVEVLRVGLGEYSPSLQQIRDLLFRSPTGYLSNEETLAAYKDLRRGLSDLLAAEKAIQAVEELAP